MTKIETQTTWNPESDYNSWSDENKEIFRQWLRELLSKMVVSLTFVKKDGTIRKMQATTQEDLTAPTLGIGRKENDSVVAVTDVDINEWRSIRFDSIKEIKFNLE